MSWFSTQRAGREGWSLDIVSLLAVIGEGAMESHIQPMTSSWTCLLPRIMPAPQALLKASRPTRMPEFPCAIAGIMNGTSVGTLNFFPNIIHPLDEQPAFGFKVYSIKHKDESPPVTRRTSPKESKEVLSEGELPAVEAQRVKTTRSESTLKQVQRAVTNTFSKPLPHIPTRPLSPLNILSIASCLLTIGLLTLAALIRDGTACIALTTLSLSTTTISYATWWTPILKRRPFPGYVPSGDVAIRTREGAFLLIHCNENIARELYTGTEECHYVVPPSTHRLLVGTGTFLFMLSVVLLGNCDFPMQAAIGGSYMLLNGLFWLLSLANKKRFWDLGIYVVEERTPRDAMDAHVSTGGGKEGVACFTRSMWYAIRETGRVDWVRRMGAAPDTPEWDAWLREAEEEAKKGNRGWEAVRRRGELFEGVDAREQQGSHSHSVK
ncbi:hypothetical protein HYFRA_00009410 [Hymenoscyphus fraxineus]|uniref:Uncharacterized protein n=1 Tax=Hymenoscyphus fraxineus TaxID=746836 RepID=A0A9N9L2Y2_9HELO|nr:hypothetical protein HYFRA_00009410 [Hymenoscyphus fraxineus]